MARVAGPFFKDAGMGHFYCCPRYGRNNNMKTKILIIDDDEKLNKLLVSYLSKFNFHVDAMTHPENALLKLKSSQPDLIILDIMLPGMDGFEVCKRIRKDYTIPVIMLTARGDVTDRIVGLEIGADDYLPKPFEPRELVARIQSVIRRSRKNEPGSITKIGDLEIDHDTHAVKIGGKEIELTTMEFELLSLFAKNPNIVLNRDVIYERIKGLDSETYDRSIDVMISRIRQKMNDDPKNPRYLKTVWGSGYKFIGKK
jgi:DNA-binding response OmpR family regulator